MPYYLNNASSNTALITIPNITIGATVGDYIEIRAVATAGNAGGEYRIVGANDGAYANIIDLAPSGVIFRANNVRNTITAGYVQPTVGSIFTLRATKASATTWQLTLNGSNLGSPFTNNGNLLVGVIFSINGATTIEAFRGGIYHVDISTNGGASSTRYYDPSASGGVGNLLIDRVSNQNGTQAGTWPADNSEWVSYAPAGGVTHTGGGVCSFVLDVNGGGQALRNGGGICSFTLSTVGGGNATRNGGGLCTFALDAVGSGNSNRIGGGLFTFTLNATGGGTVTRIGGGPANILFAMTGGGEVIPVTAEITGGATLLITFGMTGGGTVIRNGGSLTSFNVSTTGGGTASRIGGGNNGLTINATGGGTASRIGGGSATINVDATGAGFITVGGGGELTIHVDMTGGGNVQTPGYKPSVRAPVVAVNTSIRVPYSLIVKKTYRGAVCKL